MDSNETRVGVSAYASLVIDDQYYSVQSYELTLTHNGIPELRAVLDAYHDPWEAWDGKAIAVDLPKFYAKYHDLSSRCQAYPRPTAFFEAGIVYSDSRNDQELILDGWILSGVGIAGLAASGGEIGLRVRLRHPAAVLEDSPAALNVYPSLRDPTTTAVTVIDAIYKMADSYKLASGADTTDKEILGGGVRARQRYSDVVSALRTLVVTDPTTKQTLLPGSALPLAFQRAMIPSVWKYFLPQTNQTFWDWMSHTLFSEYGLALVPSYWTQALRLRAFNPWGPVEISIGYDEVAELHQPSLSISTVAGIDVVLELAAESNATVIGFKSPSASLPFGHVFYVEDIAGSIMTYGLPKWFQFATSDAKRGSRSVRSEGTAVDATPTVLNNTGSGTTEAASVADTYTAAELMARQIFMEEFRRNDEILLTMPLTLRTPGSAIDPDATGRGYLVPGVVAAVYSGPAAAPLLNAGEETEINRFYVSAVTHGVDCKSGTAQTTVKGAYVRGADSDGEAYMAGIKALTADGTYEHILYRAGQSRVHEAVGAVNPLAPPNPLTP